MANGPLALLGDALASGTGDWANIQREQRAYDRARTDRKADIAEARTFQREDLRDQREHEATLYKERKLDAIRFELIRDGHLAPADANVPEAFAEALAKTGPDYKELLNYKTEARLGRAPAGLLSLDVSQIAQAREMMIGHLGETKNTEEKGLDAAAKLINDHVAAIAKVDRDDAGIDSEITRLTDGRFNANEEKQIKDLALSSIEAGDLAKKKKWTVEDHQRFSGIQAKYADILSAQKRYSLMKQKEGLNKERVALRSRDTLVGTAISNPKIASRLVAGGAPAALVAEAAAPVAKPSTADFVNALSGGVTPAAVAAASTKTPTLVIPPPPIAFSSDQGIAAGVGQQLGASIGGLVRSGLNLFKGDDFSRGINNLPAALRADNTPQSFMGEIPILTRAMEDRILASQPYSAKSAEIRRRRGMTPILDARPPAPLLDIPPLDPAIFELGGHIMPNHIQPPSNPRRGFFSGPGTTINR